MLQCSCKRKLKSIMHMLKCSSAQQPMSRNELSHVPHGGAGIERVNGRKGQQREWEGTSVEETALQKARLSLPFDLFHAHWELSQWARRVHGGSGRLVCMAYAYISCLWPTRRSRLCGSPSVPHLNPAPPADALRILGTKQGVEGVRNLIAQGVE